ncbi:hypothetical protein F2P81_018876 [Scophthalmus maximus]|uniref:Uncharacterized protein n=1 Tax=Scophthalmus maximus TaxID=52904 RepID=A0A6A4SF44_SCOMX|nr:hypothetical protein F2P81_018876 [Scophthalmus maximus]
MVRFRRRVCANSRISCTSNMLLSENKGTNQGNTLCTRGRILDCVLYIKKYTNRNADVVDQIVCANSRISCTSNMLLSENKGTLSTPRRPSTTACFGAVEGTEQRKNNRAAFL